MINYMDPIQNSITRSSVEKVSQIDLPLFYFYAGEKLYDLDVEYVKNGDKINKYQDLIVVDSDNFEYNSNITKWTLVYFGNQGIFYLYISLFARLKYLMYFIIVYLLYITLNCSPKYVYNLNVISNRF